MPGAQFPVWCLGQPCLLFVLVKSIQKIAVKISKSMIAVPVTGCWLILNLVFMIDACILLRVENCSFEKKHQEQQRMRRLQQWWHNYDVNALELKNPFVTSFRNRSVTVILSESSAFSSIHYQRSNVMTLQWHADDILIQFRHFQSVFSRSRFYLHMYMMNNEDGTRSVKKW